MKLLIKNGHVVDPSSNIDEVTDILVENEKISQISSCINISAEQTIDAAGKIVIPGLVDMHVHLREPGREDKETVETGTKAALRGGVTSVLAMPNTSPAIDSSENIELLKRIIEKSACANVFICAAITKGRLGKTLTDIEELKKQGAVAVSDDGSSVDNENLLLESLKKPLLVICHSEDKALSNNGAINLGFISTKLGLRGIPKESEYKRIERDIKLAKKAHSPIHITHVSCKESVEIIAQAKKNGTIDVTADTAPHYFALTQENAAGYDTNMKMNPPLRTKNDVEAVKQGLKSGIIDAIASDHAPHREYEKDIEFERAEFGVTGLETELAVSITELIDTGLLTWAELVQRLSSNPAKILGIKKGSLRPGMDADITIVSADKEWIVERQGFVSKSVNSAFLGRRLKGVVEYTICSGKIAYKNTNGHEFYEIHSYKRAWEAR